jgi:N-acetylglutamate synthase-like GNAT family acetyltransferase
MDDVNIVGLTNKNSEYLNTICTWIYNWWGKIEGWSFEKVYEQMGNSLSKNKIPKTFIAIKNNVVIGMYQFIMADRDTRQDIYPCLTNIYVDEKYRNKGLGKLLIEHSINEAKKLGVKELYLYTEHIGLYEKYGWEYIENVTTYEKVNSVERLYVYRIKEEKAEETKTVTILYTNYKGVTRKRKIIPISMEFKSTQWHEEKQWILEALDIEKKEMRSFAIKDIKEWN